MSSDLRYHKASNTYIARRRSYFENDVIIDGNFIAGAASSFWKGLSVKGTLKLGKESSVRGNVKADDIVIGPGCEINGNVEAYSDLKLFDSVTVNGLAIAGGTISIRPGCSLGFARANATLELIGKVNIKEIESGTKIIVRSE
ncbi:polymer-forming cytoskeletal protein [Methanolobus sp.]|uniref:polymer-forming cytoskeletal protein n=1 Tax=Methanolobus sp. TaxID=1874737 RepID=UPI0025EC08CB|nr:polymer-forming cytoskeletal protein [Methanolobus sp.]